MATERAWAHSRLASREAHYVAMEPVDRHLHVRGAPACPARSASVAAVPTRGSLGVAAVTTEPVAITAQERAC